MHNCNSRKINKAALLGDGVVRVLEHRLAELLQNRFHCLSVTNATSGLTAVLRCFPPGNIIAPLFTSPATWAAVEHAGHSALFCDIDPISVCLCPLAVSRRMETATLQMKTGFRAIVTVNIFGHMSDLVGLTSLARQVGAVLIVDAAQSLATCLANPEYLSLADIVVFSLGPNKWLSCADGGIIAVRNADLWAELVRSTQPVQRQMLDLPQKSINFAHYNYRINPYTAKQAVVALRDMDQRRTECQHQQSATIDQLVTREAIEPLPDDAYFVFEPLTAVPLKQLDGYFLSDLPLPVPPSLGASVNLSETARQFCHRKVIRLIPVKDSHEKNRCH